MLYRVMAPEGRGKTSFLFGRMKERLDIGQKRIFVIVPEQASAETEREVALRLGDKANESVEVTNFSRLSNLVLREYGQLARHYISDLGKKILYFELFSGTEGSAGLQEALKELNVKPDPDFVEALIAETEELRLSGLDAETLIALSQKEELGERLRGKLEDFAAILASYKQALKDRFDDPTDDLSRLSAILDVYPFFDGACVYIDSFWDFTAPELGLIKRILAQAEEVGISFVCEKGENPLFSKGKQAARDVLRLARISDCEVRDVYPEAEQEEDEISFLSENLLRLDQSFEGAVKKIRLVSCQNAFDEAAFITDAILELVHGGAKWSEMAVLSRSGELDKILSLAFEKHGVPHFVEEKTEISGTGTARTLLLGATLAAGKLRPENVRAYLKTAVLDCPEEDVFLLEKYALTWNLSGRVWLDGKDFTMNPDGLVPLDERQCAELERVNRAKRAVFQPIRELSYAMTDGPFEEKITALIAFLQKNRVEEQLLAEADAKRKSGDFEGAGQCVRLWNSVLDRLGEALRVMGPKEVSGERFLDILTLALSGRSDGQVPPAQDMVQIGTLPFARPAGTKYVFIPGLNAGAFPPEKKAGRILTSPERDELERLGYALGEGYDAQLFEYFLFYLGLSRAGEGLFLSWSAKAGPDGSGGALSVIGRRVLRVLPGLQAEAYDPAAVLPKTKEGAFAYLCGHADSPDAAFLEDYFSKLPPYKERLQAARNGKAFWNEAFRLEKERPYAGKDVNMSYSRMETYTKCRYAYFARYLLEAKESGKTSFGANHAGNFVHAVLEKVLLTIYGQGRKLSELSAEELAALNGQICEEATEELLQSGLPERFLYLLEKLKKSTGLLLQNLAKEFGKSGFRPVFFEKQLEELGGYRVALPDGKALRIFGAIDRVDLYRAETGEDYVRVVDYKTGSHSFSLAGVANGLDLQMLIYLFALWSGGFELEGKKVSPSPAGVLYLNGTWQSQSCDNGEELRLVSEDPFSSFSREGLLVDDPSLLLAQDPDRKGEFIPVSYHEKKGYGTKNLISLERLGKLREKVESDFRTLAAELKAGRIEALPLTKGGSDPLDPCLYCAYKAMCKNPPENKRYFVKEEDVKNVLSCV